MKRASLVIGTTLMAGLAHVATLAQQPPLSAIDRDLAPRLSLEVTSDVPPQATFTLDWWGGNGRVYLGLEDSFSLPEDIDRSHVLRDWNAVLPPLPPGQRHRPLGRPGV